MASNQDFRLSKANLNKLVPSIATNWYDLGLELLNDEDADQLDLIDKNNKQDVEICCRKMLFKWLDTQPDASWSQLIKALHGVTLHKVACDIEKLLMDAGSSGLAKTSTDVLQKMAGGGVSKTQANAEKGEPRTDKETNGGTPKKVQAAQPKDIVSTDEDEPVKKKPTVQAASIEVKDESVKTTASDVLDQATDEGRNKDLIYPRYSNRKPIYSVIFSNDFKEEEVKYRRSGADKDVEMLQGLSDYGLFTDPELVYKNKNVEQMRKILAKVVKKSGDLDGLVVSILTHGQDGKLLGIDGLRKVGDFITIEQLTDIFNWKNCKGLREKPKIFIINACRGENRDPDAHAVTESGDHEQKLKTLPPGFLPNDADFLYVYSTADHHVSYHYPKAGSVFIESLKLGLAEMLEKGVHFEEALLGVKREMAGKDITVTVKDTVYKYRQIASVTSQMRDKLHFTKKK